jgi:hypothetical protein
VRQRKDMKYLVTGVNGFLATDSYEQEIEYMAE